jgi:hypothetical protein
MADVFISYARERRKAVLRIAEALQKLKFVVWFDAELSSGVSFQEEIDLHADQSKAVLVVWSPEAILSRWVRAESLIGFNADKLAVAFIEPPDNLKIPTPFNSIHGHDLSEWISQTNNGEPSQALEWKGVVTRLGSLCSRGGLREWLELPTEQGPERREALENWASSYIDDPLAEEAWDEASALRNEEAKANSHGSRTTSCSVKVRERAACQRS